MEFRWSTHRVMGGCTDTGRTSSTDMVGVADELLRGWENERGDELHGRVHACVEFGIPASLMRRRREHGWREGRRCWWRWPAGQTWMSEVAEEDTGMRG